MAIPRGTKRRIMEDPAIPLPGGDPKHLKAES